MTRERLRFAACFVAALGCHAAVLFAIRAESGAKALALGEPDSAVELALVEAAPLAAPAPLSAAEAPPAEPPRSPEPAPPDPVPIAPPPSFEPVAPPPVPTREQPELKPAPKPRPAPRTTAMPAPRQAAPLPITTTAPAPSETGGKVGAAAGKPCAAAGSGANTKLRTRYNPRPEYPAEARRQKQTGVVSISAEVSAQGVPTSVSVARSSGFPLLDQAALAAVRRWRFEPGRVAGVAVPGRAELPVRFNLQN